MREVGFLKVTLLSCWSGAWCSPRARSGLREALPEVLENANENLTAGMRNLVAMLWNEWKDLELQIVEMKDEVRTDRFERCGMHETSDRSLASDLWLPPRSWLRSATAQPSARDESSPHGWGWSKQYSTGGKAKLYGISKRGNNYLGKILVHGARAVVLRSKRERIAIGAWMTSLETRGFGKFVPDVSENS